MRLASSFGHDSLQFKKNSAENLAQLETVAYDLLKVAATKIVFLDYKPSLIASAALSFALSLQELKAHSPTKFPQIFKLKSTKQPYPSYLEFGIHFWQEHLTNLTDIYPADFLEAMLILSEAALETPTFMEDHLTVQSSQ